MVDTLRRVAGGSHLVAAGVDSLVEDTDPDKVRRMAPQEDIDLQEDILLDYMVVEEDIPDLEKGIDHKGVVREVEPHSLGVPEPVDLHMVLVEEEEDSRDDLLGNMT